VNCFANAVPYGIAKNKGLSRYRLTPCLVLAPRAGLEPATKRLTGRKAWVAIYHHGDVKRRLTIGTYPAL